MQLKYKAVIAFISREHLVGRTETTLKAITESYEHNDDDKQKEFDL